MAKINPKRTYTTEKIDSDFQRDMREIARIRLSKGLANLKPRELSMAEMTRLLRRTDGYNISLNELKTKPKRK